MADDQLTNSDALIQALRGGADAVFVFRFDEGDLVAEVANETARLLFGLPTSEAAAGTADVLSQQCPPAARPILSSLERAATRSRATRETLMLPAPDGERLAVDVQLEPLPVSGSEHPRVLAVVRAADQTFEPGASGASPSRTHLNPVASISWRCNNRRKFVRSIPASRAASEIDPFAIHITRSR